MTTPRHKAREIALQILYQYDVKKSLGVEPPSGPTLSEDIHRHFEHFNVQDEIRAFSAELVIGTLREQEILDEQIEKQAANWKMARMAPIDRNIIRMAFYEMRTQGDIPPAVTLDEAVELAKSFGTTDSAGFVNGVLDPLSKSASISERSTG